MKVIDEGKQAFFNHVDKLLAIPSLSAIERQVLIGSRIKIENGENWSQVLLNLLTFLTAQAMGLNLSPELRDFYSRLYNNRQNLENLKEDVEGSMTLLIIFD